MGWQIGFDEKWNRDIGYGVPATCDHPDCDKQIDRGLAYVCGGDPYGGERGCGLYFCEAHLRHPVHASMPSQLCARCYPNIRKPFAPKPDVAKWIKHKATDPSWAEWRAEQAADGNPVPVSVPPSQSSDGDARSSVDGGFKESPQKSAVGTAEAK